MSTLSTYKTLLSEELGTSETTFATDTKRVRAINQATRWIGNNYNVPDLQIEASITFTSGIGTIPTRFLKNERMMVSSTDSTEFPEYTREEFRNIGRGFTIGYDTTAAARRVKVKPTTTTSALWSYFQKPNASLSADADDSGLPAESDIAVSKYAAYLILYQKGKLDEAKDMFAGAKEEARLWANTFEDSDTYITSVYQNTDYLQGNINSNA